MPLADPFLGLTRGQRPCRTGSPQGSLLLNWAWAGPRMGEGVVAVQARHLQGSRGKSHLLSWLRSPQMRRGGGGGGSCGPSAGASEGRTLRLSALVSDAWPPSPAQPYSRPWHGWPWYLPAWSQAEPADPTTGLSRLGPCFAGSHGRAMEPGDPRLPAAGPRTAGDSGRPHHTTSSTCPELLYFPGPFTP